MLGPSGPIAAQLPCPCPLRRVSVSSAGEESNAASLEIAISADGRFATYKSSASNLIPGDDNANSDIFIHDLQLETTELVSVSLDGGVGDNASDNMGISQTGRFVTFDSLASDLVANDTNDFLDIFVRDRATGTTERVNVSSSGEQAALGGKGPGISNDGRYVAFVSEERYMVPGDGNRVADLFVHDGLTHTTTRASVGHQR